MAVEETPGMDQVTKNLSSEQTVPANQEKIVQSTPVIETSVPSQTTEVVEQQVPEDKMEIPVTGKHDTDPKTEDSPQSETDLILEKGYLAVGEILQTNHPSLIEKKEIGQKTVYISKIARSPYLDESYNSTIPGGFILTRNSIFLLEVQTEDHLTLNRVNAGIESGEGYINEGNIENAIEESIDNTSKGIDTKIDVKANLPGIIQGITLEKIKEEEKATKMIEATIKAILKEDADEKEVAEKRKSSIISLMDVAKEL